MWSQEETDQIQGRRGIAAVGGSVSELLVRVFR